MVSVRQPSKKPIHLARDVVWVTEGAVALVNSHGAVVASPAIDVLKQVAVESAIMGGVQSPLRKRFRKAELDGNGFVLIQSSLIAKSGAIAQHRRADIAVGVRLRLVAVVGQALATLRKCSRTA